MPEGLAQLLKKRKREENETPETAGDTEQGESQQESIDEQIKRLEAELGDSDGSGSEDSDGSDGESDQVPESESDEEIEALPAHMLPAPASKRRIKMRQKEESGKCISPGSNSRSITFPGRTGSDSARDEGKRGPGSSRYRMVDTSMRR